MNSGSVSTILSIILTFGSFEFVACAAEPPNRERIVGGGILSQDGKSVYVALRGGGIEARELETGKAAWKYADGLIPLDPANKIVLAWSEGKKPKTFLLAALDAATGKVVHQSDAFEFPAEVPNLKGADFEFWSRAKCEADSAEIRWTAFRDTGRTPSRHPAPGFLDVKGVVKWSFKSGKVERESVWPKRTKNDFWDVWPEFLGKAGDFEFAKTVSQEKDKGESVEILKKVTVSKKGKELWSWELPIRFERKRQSIPDGAPNRP